MGSTSGTGTSIIDALRLFSKGLLDHLCVMVTAHHPSTNIRIHFKQELLLRTGKQSINYQILF